MREFNILSRWQLVPVYFFMLPGLFVILLAVASLILRRLEFVAHYGIFLGAVAASSVLSFMFFYGVATSIKGDEHGLTVRRWHRPDLNIPAGQIISLSPSRFRGGFFTLRHTAGNVPLPGQFTGFHDLVNMIKRHSPTADIRGC